MRLMKMFALSVLALTVGAGVGTASATELYKWKNGVERETLSQGTTVTNSFTSSVTFVNTAGNIYLNTCTGGEFSGTTSTTGSATTTVVLPLSSLTWSECLEPTSTTVKGEIEIHHIPETTNGTLTLKNTTIKITSSIYGREVCPYTAGAGAHMGTMINAGTSVGHADGAINVVLSSENPLCPEIVMKANYKVTSPTGLVVDPG